LRFFVDLGFGRRRYGRLFLTIAGLLVLMCPFCAHFTYFFFCMHCTHDFIMINNIRKLEIWGKAQRESVGALSPMGEIYRGEISPVAKSRGPHTNAVQM